MKKSAILIFTTAVLLAGCATSSRDIKSIYVSPITYQSHTCEQLIQENQRIQARIGELAGSVDQRASKDQVKMGVGLVLFWPTLFFLKGDGAEAQEYARLKGEHTALESAYNSRNCTRQAS